MVASCPSLRYSFRRKHLSHAEKQSCLQDLLQCCDCALSCAMRLLQTNVCGESFLQHWVGSGAASLLAVHVRKMRSTAGKEICSTCLFKASIAAIPLEKAKHPLPTRSLRLLRAAVCSAISALNYGCIMPIPSLQLQKKPALRTEVIVSKIWITGY